VTARQPGAVPAAKHGRPRVSVVMPTLNQVGFLAESVRSVCAQPEVDELVVVDGGSTDGTLPLLQALAAEHPGRLRWVSASDSGPAQAVNRAVALACGDVIGWLNSDDLYLPGAVRRALSTMAGLPGSVMVYGEGEHIDVAGAAMGRYPTLPPSTPLEAFAQGCFVCQPTAFFRRDTFIALGGLDEGLRTAFDFDLWLRLFKTFPGAIGFVPMLQAQSRLHAGSITLRQRGEVALEGMAVLHRHLGSAPPAWLLTHVAELCALHPFEPEPIDLVSTVSRLAAAARPCLTPAGWQLLEQRLQADRSLQLARPELFVPVMPDGWAGPSLPLRLRQAAQPVQAVVLRCRHASPVGGALHIDAAGEGFAPQAWQIQRPGPFELVLTVRDHRPGAALVCQLHCQGGFVPAECEPGSTDTRPLAYVIEACDLIRSMPG
jgi:hypothetical protein